MSKKWTNEQLEAVKSRFGNLLVAAAAGAGKTSVLVERIISRVTGQAHPVDVDRLLVVTFTNAAAAEMRDRIGRALNSEINRRPGSVYLRRQLALLNHACICTMHSFCLDLMRQHFYRIDLDPSFRVADETEAALVQLEALEGLLEQRYAAAANHPFTSLVDCYGGKRDDTLLQQMVLEAYQFARSTPRPLTWLSKLPEGFSFSEDTSFEQLTWSDTLRGAVKFELAGAIADLEQALILAGRPGGPEVYLAEIRADLERVVRLYGDISGSAPWSSLYNDFNDTIFGRLKGIRKGDAERRQAEQAKKFRDNARKKITALKKEFFSRLPEQLCADLRRMHPLIKEFAGLVSAFGDSYREAKSARGLVDFSDLEHFALQILAGQDTPDLVPSAAALELRERFEEVLVDEYQDTNAVQEAILEMVSRQGEKAPNLFMVGDVKQSIYRFRLAEPGLFLGKYSTYQDGPYSRERRLVLSRNFRSRRGVVDAVNFVFRQLMTPGVGEMAYGKESELVYGAGYELFSEGENDPDEAVEMHLMESAATNHDNDAVPVNETPLESGEQEGSEKAEDELDSVQKEARLIASRIKELVMGTADGVPGMFVYDKELNTRRPLAYKDVVVLLRATAGYANSYMEEFRQEGIPAYADLSTGYFEATEVDTVLSLLKLIDNPRQDVPLAAVLRSPIAGLDAGDLAKIRLASPRGEFLDAVLAATITETGELQERLTLFLEKLEKWRSAARQGPLADLIWTIYRETGYYDFVGGLPGGRQRQANLRALHHRARQYEATAFRGLFLFLRFIERVREGGRDLGTARALSEKENVVRIMSIHKSKGLEFPVVIVGGLGRKFNFRDLSKDMLFHKDLGLGPQFIDAESRISFPTVAKLALRHKLKLEALAEEMRVLYVAMTRAKEKLVLVGSVRDLPGCSRRWCGPVGTKGWALPDGCLAGAVSYLDWLAPALARHRDGLAIRKMSGWEVEPPEHVAGDGSRWQVCFAGGAATREEQKLADLKWLSKVRCMEPVEDESPLAGTVRARLEWHYHSSELVGKAAKASVTELKRRFDHLASGDSESLSDYRAAIGGRPRFIQEGSSFTSAEKGTALHLVMQSVDLKGVLDQPAIACHIAFMVERELLSSEQALSVPVEKIAAFFECPLGRRVLAARKVYRELPFTMTVPACEVYPGLMDYGDEQVLVQGVVDCLVDEGDSLMLLDYKTDRIMPGMMEKAAARYRDQLRFYTRAVEEILGRKVSEKYLYLFDLGLELKCD